MRAIDYYGVVEVEFKQDPRDGKYKLLDVNARTWGFHILGLPAGVDFPYLLFADQMGLPLEDCRGKAGIGWLRWLTDVPTAFSDVLHGYLSVGAYWSSLRRTRIESVFSKEDPLPSLMEKSGVPQVLTCGEQTARTKNWLRWPAHLGIAAGFKSEWWPASNRNTRPD